MKLGTKHVIFQKFANFTQKKLTGLKVSSLARKYVFCRPEYNAKDGPNGVEF